MVVIAKINNIQSLVTRYNLCIIHIFVFLQGFKDMTLEKLGTSNYSIPGYLFSRRSDIRYPIIPDLIHRSDYHQFHEALLNLIKDIVKYNNTDPLICPAWNHLSNWLDGKYQLISYMKNKIIL